jgi:hypothetical protein
MINVGYVLNIYKNNIVQLKMNYNPIRTMNHYKKILLMIIPIVELYEKIERVVQYVIINNEGNKQD